MTTIGSWLNDQPDLDRLEGDLLLGEVLGLDRAQIISHPERQLQRAELAVLQRLAQRRQRGEPAAYILGRKEFWSLELQVTPAVLIPRPETEILVEQALAISRQATHKQAMNEQAVSDQVVSGRGQRVLDLGTGSGAIAIAIATELPHAEVCASDVSQAALKVAATNAASHAAAITFIASDWFVNISGSFHTIVSNPPYVPQADPHLPSLEAEPRRALVSGREGLDAIRYIVPAARAHLADHGWLIIEHGHDQGPAVRELMLTAGYRRVSTAHDLAGLERVSRGQWQGAP